MKQETDDGGHDKLTKPGPCQGDTRGETKILGEVHLKKDFKKIPFSAEIF